MLNGKCAMMGDSIALDKEGSYESIISDMIACIIVVILDEIYFPGRASSNAHEELDASFAKLLEAIGSHFDRDTADTRKRDKSLLSAFQKLYEHNDEAGDEPRWWRTPWKQDIFAQTADFLQRMRYNVRSLETAGATGFAQGGAKDQVFQALLESPGFQMLGQNLKDKVGIVRRLASVFVHETTKRFPLLEDKSTTMAFRDETERLVSEVMGEVAASKALQREGAVAVREDPVCRIIVQLAYVRSMFQDVREMQHNLLRAC